MSIGILCLAAGRSQRFGLDKRLAPLPDGQPVLDAFLRGVELSGLPFLVCLDESDDELAASLAARHIDFYQCRRAREGMGGTLAEGAGLISHWDGVLIALADMPWITAQTYLAVAQHLEPDNICIPLYEGHRGHPVGFGRDFLLALSELGGTIGALNLIADHADRVVELAVPDPGIIKDIDVPADLGGSP